MWQYLKTHELQVREALDGDASPDILAALRDTHARRLSLLQHERLIHLLVTLFVALFFLLSLGFALSNPGWAAGALALVLLVLTCAYLLHYYRLENGVQRLYQLSDRIEEKLPSPDVAPTKNPGSEMPSRRE
jgi:hypothetical protein